MEITITLKEIFEGTIKTFTIFDIISPEGGYSENYLQRAAQDYADNRAVEQFGGITWEVVSVQKLSA